MAYNIVKHRRGTTQEWLDIDLVPENGELVIEECLDGTRKCKIGDGILSFTNLPYIDAETQAKLLSELDELRRKTSDEINQLDKTLRAEVLSSKQELKKSIQEATTALKDNFDDTVKNLQLKVNTERDDAIDSLQKELEHDISAASVNLQAAIEEVREDAEKNTSDLAANVNALANETSAELKTAITQVSNTFNDKLALEAQLRNSSIKVIEENLDNISDILDEQLYPTIEQLKSQHTDDLEDLDDKYTKISAKLSSDLTDKATELSTKIDTQDAKFTKALADKANKLSTDYIEKISEAVQNTQEFVDEKVTEQATELNNLRNNFETVIAEKERTWIENLGSLKTELMAADSALNSAVELLQQEDVKISEGLSKQLSDLHDKVKQLKDTDVAAIVSSVNDISATVAQQTSDLSNNMDSLAKRHIDDYARLISELARIEEAQKVADNALNETLIDAITKIYLELADLVDDDLLILRKVYTVEAHSIERINNLNSKIAEETTKLRQTFSTDLAELSSAMTENSVSLEQRLADSIASVSSLLTTSLNSLRTITDSRFASMQHSIDDLANSLDAVDSENKKQISEVRADIGINRAEALRAINRVANDVASVDAKTTSNKEAIEVQSERISRIIALNEGSTTGDLELMDIREGYNGKLHPSAGDAVRAVGNDVKALRESLSQYIDTQAIDGLHYDYSGEVGLMQPYMLYLTADGEVLEDSGVQIISGGSGGGGGSSTASSLKLGYITNSPIVTTANDNTVLKFTFSGTDSSGDAILQAAATWKVNNAAVAYSTVKDGENEFDITKYLSVGTTKVLLVVTDDNGSVVTKSWSIQQIDLSVDSLFDDKSTYPANEEVIFTYTPYGSVDKTAIFKLDGVELDRVLIAADVSGDEVKYRIPPQQHGSHLLEFYLEANINGEMITSNHKLKDILFYDPTAKSPIIGTSAPNLKTKQYSTVNIIYTVYDPEAETPTVTIKVDDEEVSTATLRANSNYNNTPTGVYSYTETEVGAHTVKIICKDTVKTITVDVEKLGIEIFPITTGLAFDFNPAGRSNGDAANRLWSHGNVHMRVSNNFDWTNGGYIPDDPNGPCFCVKAGSTATIDYKLFADDAKKYGKEFKLVFKTENVANPDATFLTCLDHNTGNDHIGIDMGVHTAHIYGQNGNLELAYSEDDIIEFEFNISKNTELVPMVMGYEDGVPSRPMVYDDSYSFTQGTPKEIVIGSPDCDVYIYRFKVYNTSLTNTDILNNFIADARTAEEMISRYTRNQIYDENNKLTPEELAEKCPWLRVYKISAPHFTNNKSDKVKNTTIYQLYKNGDPILDNWVCYNAQHSGQGTSSNNYGAAGRNLDFIMNKDDAYFELGDGTTASAITLTRESVPVAYLNAKVNIASSNNLTNAILANRYNEFNPYRRPFAKREGVNLSYIKDTMEFHNCVIFIQETDPDLTTHREFADTDWHFYAIGNIGDSKKTDNTRATDPDDKYECCVEIMDVGLPLSDFPVNTMVNAMGYSIDEKTGEKIYLWAKQENLDILHELIDGEYVKTSDTEIDLEKVYYIDILENDDFSEDYTYGWRYIYDDEDQEVVDYCKNEWIKFYRFVTTSSDAEFKEKLSDYFVVDSALYYYLFTTRYCMVDNRAKNTFWHYSKTADGTRKWDLCWDYDNDTALGLNNYGKQVYRYGLEDIDKDAAGEEIFRESDSTFFCRVRDLFESELKQMYNDLESKNAWHAESFLNTCDAWQNEFPEELWRLDIERKYLRTYTSSFINGKGDSQFLVNMCNGRMKYHRRQWERSQEQYMASKYQTIRASGDNYHANFRFGVPNTDDPSVPANYQLTLTPFSYIYLNVHYGGTACSTVRAEPNVPTVVPYSGKTADIVNVYNAAAIRDFGDLSPCYPKTVSIGNATRVKKLTLGNKTEGYDNAAFTTLTTGANPLLEDLNIENISSLSQALNLKELTNLKKLYAFGTSVPSVIFAEGGKIEYAELPAINNITLKNLLYLATDNFKLSNYDNVIDMVIEDCPQINQASLFNRCQNLRRARLTNVDFGTVTYDYFETKIFNLKGLNANGTETPDAILIGTVNFDYLTGSQFNELKARYPQLVITYNTLESTIIFKDTDLETTVHQGTVFNGADYEDPVCYDSIDDIPVGMIAKPAKTSTDEFDFEFFGWSSTPSIILSSTDVTTEIYNKYRIDSIKKVEGDRVLYPVFKTVRRSYPVHFINPTITENNGLLETVYTPYGSDAVYSGVEPSKGDTISPNLYSFTGWYPKPENITGELKCFAQFTVLDNKWYTIGINDITDYVDYNGIRNGYVLYDNQTMAITGCSNKYNPAVRIPEQLDVLRENFASGTDLVITLDEDTYKTITFDYKFTEGSELSFGLYDKDLQSYYGRYLLGPNGTVDNYAGINVEQHRNGYYRVTLTLALLDKLNDGLNLENVPSTPNVLKFSCSGESVLGFVDNVCGINDTTEKVFLVNNYTVVSLGGFTEHTLLELIDIPETVNEIQLRAFYNCYNLSELSLPESITTIGKSAFQSCSRIKELTIPASVTSIGEAAFADCPSLSTIKVEEGNLKYGIENGCLIDLDNQLLIQGLSTSTIPDSVRKLGQHCFSSTAIATVRIPEGVTAVSNNAFSRCESLTSVNLPNSLLALDATCFAWCPKLKNINNTKTDINVANLPDGLTDIRTYVFDSCALEHVIIPASVVNVLERAFGDMTSLREVKFKKRLDQDGNIIVPNIHAEAFANSGSTAEPIKFYLPWKAEQTPAAPWGAQNAELIFEYEEGMTNA